MLEVANASQGHERDGHMHTNACHAPVKDWTNFEIMFDTFSRPSDE